MDRDFDIFKTIEEEHFNQNEDAKYDTEYEDEDEYYSDEEDSQKQNNIKSECKHKYSVKESGIMICTDCGTELYKIVSHDKDWRYYGSNDTSLSSDPSRCFSRKGDESHIFKDIENFVTPEVYKKTFETYEFVMKGKYKIYKGISRKAIIFGCLFYSLKNANTPYSCNYLQNIFDLDKKSILKGIKHVNMCLPKKTDAKMKYISPIEIINEYLEVFKYTPEDKEKISLLYNIIKEKNSAISRSRPQSIASSIIWWFFSKVKKTNITIKEYVKKIKLSELTILKLTKEIEKVFPLN